MSQRAPGARSIRELAPLVGRSHVAVAKWVKDDRWTFGPGPWDGATVVRIRQWAEATLSTDPAAPGDDAGSTTADLSPGRKADLALKSLRAARIKFDLDKVRGEYHRVDECRARRVRQIEDVKKRLLDLADGLPFESDVKELVRNRLVGVLRELAGPAGA